MEGRLKRLPVGIEYFSELREGNFYYVDKTGLICNLLDDWAKVSLFTRPRRFGKSLNMDMLRMFFEQGTDPSVFEGLEISSHPELCEEYMGKYPVISLSLKDVNGADYASACQMLAMIVSNEADRLCRKYQLLESGRLTENDRDVLNDMLSRKFEFGIAGSLKTLSKVLYTHCGTDVVVLIDEYDVPLDKAYQNGYYDQMLGTIRDMLSMVLKTNPYLNFAVLTGCLRIAKESIFTGLNNFVVNSISDIQFAEYFGFTDDEVKAMLEYYQLGEFYGTIKEWYDGYQFGQVKVYCPWDVVNYLRKLRVSREAKPEAFWVNSSSNSIIQSILTDATQTTKNQIEMLISGEVIEKKIMPELTYKDLDNEDITVRETYLWSVLYATGYLTDAGRAENGLYRLKIPNREVREIYDEKIKSWYNTKIRSNTKRWQDFCAAVRNGDAAKFEELFNACMGDAISIRDTAVRKERKENFYHGMLLGILQCEGNWIVKSNQESGLGYSDILLVIPDGKIGCAIEVKYAEGGAYEAACSAAMEQMRDKRYADLLEQEGMETIYMYGVACFRKSCKVGYEKVAGKHMD